MLVAPHASPHTCSVSSPSLPVPARTPSPPPLFKGWLSEWSDLYTYIKPSYTQYTTRCPQGSERWRPVPYCGREQHKAGLPFTQYDAGG